MKRLVVTRLNLYASTFLGVVVGGLFKPGVTSLLLFGGTSLVFFVIDAWITDDYEARFVTRR